MTVYRIGHALESREYFFSLACISYVTALISIVFKYKIMIGQNKQKMSKDDLKHISSGSCMVHFTVM